MMFNYGYHIQRERDSQHSAMEHLKEPIDSLGPDIYAIIYSTMAD